MMPLADIEQYGCAPPNKRATRALLNYISLTTGPSSKQFTELFLMVPSTKIAQMVMLQIKGPPEL